VKVAERSQAKKKAQAPHNQQFAFDWQHPDYDAVAKRRSEWLKHLRANPHLWAPLKEHYRDNPVDFITDWGMTYEPRNPEVRLPATIPFVLFPKQEEFVDWLLERWKGREDGLTEKSRDMGVSWLCISFAVWMWLFHAETVAGFGSRKEELVDDLQDSKALLWKARAFIRLLPEELKPAGYVEARHSPYMRIVNPENGASIVGEAGDNIGRGGRTSIYFKDESAHYVHPDTIDAALSQTTNCQIDVSSVNGVGNAFYRKRHGGVIPVFVFDWRDDPRKSEAWYRRQKATRDPVIVAQEIDRSYEASVSDVFIPGELVAAAMRLGPKDVPAKGLIQFGVDVARFGDDKSALCCRRGRVVLYNREYSKMDLDSFGKLVETEVRKFPWKRWAKSRWT
jgi:phage terminase large subunit